MPTVVRGNNLDFKVALLRYIALVTRHSLNAFSEPRPSWTLELMEAGKSCLLILLVIVNLDVALRRHSVSAQGASNAFPSAAYSPTLVSDHHDVASITPGEVSWESCSVLAKGGALMSSCTACITIKHAQGIIYGRYLEPMLFCLSQNCTLPLRYFCLVFKNNTDCITSNPRIVGVPYVS